jgi:GH43 family beta-xylosidase
MNGVYYYTQTLGDRIGLWATTAMSRLDRARYATIFVPPASGPNSHDLWAPELHRLDGKWYVYYAAGDGAGTAEDPFPSQRIFVLENEGADPMQGTWIDRGRLRGPDQDSWAIDGTVMEYGGQHYFIWSGRPSAYEADQYLYIARMTNPWTLAAGRVMLSTPDRDWERAGRVGVNEGPQVLRNRWGDVFLLYSANGCWSDDYSLGMLTLRTGGDPLDAADWVKSIRPVFAKNAASRAFGPGHNSFFKSPDGTQDWLIYHANSAANEGCGDTRSPRMQAIAWRTDGTPDFEGPAPIDRPLAIPAGEPPEP